MQHPPPMLKLGGGTNVANTLHFFRTLNNGGVVGGDQSMIELSEQPTGGGGHHVYTNPNYPTLEIGGMPFYLMPATAATTVPPITKDTSLTLYEPGGSSSTYSGPIYEDIDRMCTYRGSPPLRGKKRDVLASERTYCNVQPPPPPPNKNSESGESTSTASPPHPPRSHNGGGGGGGGGTSSSEVSFESGSSPRHTQQQNSRDDLSHYIDML